MHRKFIALILATALAVTGLSAVPARADGDTARLFAGLAALALLGAAIQSNRNNGLNDQQGDQSVTHNYNYSPRDTPPKYTRKDLPRKCLRKRNVNGRNRNLLGAGCLRNNYAFNATLPYACQLGYWDGNRNRTGYEPKCLRERGYRFTRG